MDTKCFQAIKRISISVRFPKSGHTCAYSLVSIFVVVRKSRTTIKSYRQALSSKTLLRSKFFKFFVIKLQLSSYLIARTYGQIT